MDITQQQEENSTMIIKMADDICINAFKNSFERAIEKSDLDIDDYNWEECSIMTLANLAESLAKSGIRFSYKYEDNDYAIKEKLKEMTYCDSCEEDPIKLDILNDEEDIIDIDDLDE